MSDGFDIMLNDIYSGLFHRPMNEEFMQDFMEYMKLFLLYDDHDICVVYNENTQEFGLELLKKGDESRHPSLLRMDVREYFSARQDAFRMRRTYAFYSDDGIVMKVIKSLIEREKGVNYVS